MTCNETDFLCASGISIYLDSFCDDAFDCDDVSDEIPSCSVGEIIFRLYNIIINCILINYFKIKRNLNRNITINITINNLCIEKKALSFLKMNNFHKIYFYFFLMT